MKKVQIHAWDKVARERFELSSRAPEAPMLDRYTTGLCVQHKHVSLLLTLMLLRVAVVFLFYRFPNAVAFLANSVPTAAVPQSVNYRVLVLGVTG